MFFCSTRRSCSRRRRSTAWSLTDKSRRVGATWGVGADAVLTAGSARTEGGMDVLYIGYNLDMAREFIDCCGMWAKAFMPACSEVSEFLFVEEGEKGAEKSIKAFRITFASGFEIVALSSKPRSLRGAARAMSSSTSSPSMTIRPNC